MILCERCRSSWVVLAGIVGVNADEVGRLRKVVYIEAKAALHKGANTMRPSKGPEDFLPPRVTLASFRSGSLAGPSRESRAPGSGRRRAAADKFYASAATRNRPQ